MKTITALIICVFYASLTFAEDVWVMNCWDNDDEGEKVFMCLEKTKNGYEGTISFSRYCKCRPQYGRIRVYGNGDQKNLKLSTRAGSNFDITYAKADDGMDFIKINPDFNPQEKIRWEASESCKDESTDVPKQYEAYMRNNRINLLQYGLQ